MVWLVLRVLVIVGVVWAMVDMIRAPFPDTMTSLTQAIEDGTVDSITLPREEPPPTGTGDISAGRQVTWTDGGATRFADYVYVWVGASPGEDAPGEGITSGETSSDPGAVIATLARGHGVRVMYTDAPTSVPAQPSYPILTLATLAALALILWGPRPRYATRWAWFWLGMVPLNLAAFALFEPALLGSRREPAPLPRRLTGGYAFLIAAVFEWGLVAGLLMRIRNGLYQ